MPVERALELLAFAQARGVSSFVVSGGEASLHPQFDSLADALVKAKPNIITVLQTNGAIRRKELHRLRGFKIVHVSYEPDGSEVRKVDSREIIKLAQDLNNMGIYAYLFVTVHQGNIDKIDSMVETANTAGLKMGFNLCVPTHEHPGLALSPEQTLQASKRLYELFLERRILRFTSPLVAILEGKQSEGYIGNRGGCTAGIAACAVTPSGDVIPCPFLRAVTAGNIYEKALDEIWLGSSVFAEMRDRSKFDNPCGSCRFISYCGGCRGRALNSSGRLTGPDTGCFLKNV